MRGEARVVVVGGGVVGVSTLYHLARKGWTDCVLIERKELTSGSTWHAAGLLPGLPNFWLNEGHSFGITAAGGAGWQLAEWIVEGEPSIDMWGVDPRRFGPYATRGYLKRKNEEAYANVFTVHYPDEERAAERPPRRAPCYDRMAALGAVFGSTYGWKRPNWFAPEAMGSRRKTSGSPTCSSTRTTRPWRKARSRRSAGASAARTTSSMSAARRATSTRRWACRT